MKKYIGVKQVSAEPKLKVTLGTSKEDYRETEGYEVVYEDGYTSWSPKEVFEKAYIETGVGVVLGKSLQDHEIRVQHEMQDLSMNLTKLKKALPGLKKLDIDTSDLEQQAIIMQAYLDILVKRLNGFGN